MKTLSTALLALGLLGSSTAALGQTRSQVYGSSITQQTQTVFVTGDEAMNTYQSKAAGSKETRAAPTVTMGGWAGEDRIIGASISASDADVPFSLNNSSMRTSFRDVRVKARLGWLIPSVGASLSEVDVTRNGQQVVGLYGTGLNAGLALAIPVANVMIVGGDANVVQSSQVYDKLNSGSKLGQRTDGELSAAYHLVERYLDFMVGYRVRQYTIDSTVNTASVQYNESVQGAFAGLRFGLYF
jgi:hypothetical protein